MKTRFNSKNSKTIKKTKNTKNSKNNRKYLRKTMKNVAKGRKGKAYKCCMCNKKFKSIAPLSPSACVMRNGKEKSHKICENCWWDKFAIEGVDHKCPGCPVEVKKPKKVSGTPEVIVISSNSH